MIVKKHLAVIASQAALVRASAGHRSRSPCSLSMVVTPPQGTGLYFPHRFLRSCRCPVSNVLNSSPLLLRGSLRYESPPHLWCRYVGGFDCDIHRQYHIISGLYSFPAIVSSSCFGTALVLSNVKADQQPPVAPK